MEGKVTLDLYTYEELKKKADTFDKNNIHLYIYYGDLNKRTFMFKVNTLPKDLHIALEATIMSIKRIAEENNKEYESLKQERLQIDKDIEELPRIVRWLLGLQTSKKKIEED